MNSGWWMLLAANDTLEEPLLPKSISQENKGEDPSSKKEYVSYHFEIIICIQI